MLSKRIRNNGFGIDQVPELRDLGHMLESYDFCHMAKLSDSVFILYLRILYSFTFV